MTNTTFEVGDRVQYCEEEMNLVGTVVDVDKTEWVTIQWDQWDCHNDQIIPL